MKNLPDFCVSSQATGFNEFLKVYNKYFNDTYMGNLKYYGVCNVSHEQWIGRESAWTTNIITPQEAIFLLTGKQLTEGDLKVKINGFDYLLSNDEIKKDDWCIVNIGNIKNAVVKNAVGETGSIIGSKDYLKRTCKKIIATTNPELIADGVTKLLPTQESATERLMINQIIKDSNELAQESVKDGSLGIEFTEQAQSAFDHYEYPNLINTLDTSAAFWIGWRQAEIFFSTQQTAHLQQQLDKAKEKIEAQGNLLESVWEKYIKLLPAKDLASLIDLLKQVQSK